MRCARGRGRDGLEGAGAQAHRRAVVDIEEAAPQAAATQSRRRSFHHPEQALLGLVEEQYRSAPWATASSPSSAPTTAMGNRHSSDGPAQWGEQQAARAGQAAADGHGLQVQGEHDRCHCLARGPQRMRPGGCAAKASCARIADHRELRRAISTAGARCTHLLRQYRRLLVGKRSSALRTRPLARLEASRRCSWTRPWRSSCGSGSRSSPARMLRGPSASTRKRSAGPPQCAAMASISMSMSGSDRALTSARRLAGRQ